MRLDPRQSWPLSARRDGVAQGRVLRSASFAGEDVMHEFFPRVLRAIEGHRILRTAGVATPLSL